MFPQEPKQFPVPLVFPGNQRCKQSALLKNYMETPIYGDTNMYLFQSRPKIPGTLNRNMQLFRVLL